jgi:hypothetical protein
MRKKRGVESALFKKTAIGGALRGRMFVVKNVLPFILWLIFELKSIIFPNNFYNPR